MRTDFLTTPEAWNRTPRIAQNRADYANPIEHVSAEEVEAAGRDVDRVIYFLFGVFVCLAAFGVLA